MEKGLFYYLLLEVMKWKFVLLIEKFIGVLLMDDFSWLDLIVVSKGVSIFDVVDFLDVVNLRFDCIGLDLLINENGIVSLDD